MGGGVVEPAAVRVVADRSRGRVGRDRQAVDAALLAATLGDTPTVLTSAQRNRLRGWASLAQWIGTPKGAAAAERVEEAWPGYQAVATASILNAYYTEPAIIDTVWSWMARNGVTGGHGWEPGCGRGDWMAGAVGEWSFDAVDIDPISVRVARQLTGQNVVESPIETWDVSRSSRREVTGYDVVVGNVPFSSIRPGRNNPQGDNLHNLAVLRSIEMLRPGGVATVITSRYALDTERSRDWRERLAEHVDLVGAFRLPARTHRSAGTDVVTDLLVLRRPLPGETRPPADWLDTVALSVDGEELRHNRYFERNPHHVLGQYEAGGAYRRQNLNVIAETGKEPAELLAAALAPIRVDYHPAGAAPQRASLVVESLTGRRLPTGSMVIDAASPTGFSIGGSPAKVAKANRAQVGALCELRDQALDYLDNPTDDGRAGLAEAYASYRVSFPPLNHYSVVNKATPGRGDVDEVELTDGGEVIRTEHRYPRYDGFRSDPSWGTVAALESFDDDTGEGVPAPILQRPIVAVDTDRWPTAAQTVGLAAANSLARFHRLDEAYIAEQLGFDVDTARVQLATIAFRSPRGGWELAAAYLSGDIVAKLDEATTAAAGDTGFKRNIAALHDVLPTPLTQAEIIPELGVTWLSAEDITNFVQDYTGGRVRVMYHPPTGRWSYEGSPPAGPAQYRTDRYGLAEQVVRACNATPVSVTRTVMVGDKEVRVPDAEASAAEQLCRDNLNEALGTWCWSVPERATTLGERYNRMFNRFRVEHHDGSHLTLPGLASDFTPRAHQKDVVWRILTSTDNGVLMAHGVGAGKTAAMVIAGYEARRTGRAQGTTLYAVPGNMVAQFALDYLRLYPAARVITPRATTREGLREFAARVATGDFDAAICSHNAFKAIPLTPETQRANIEQRLKDFDLTNADETLSRSAQRSVEQSIKRFQERLKAISETTEDPSVTYFERMGIGMIFVDEAHLAKNIKLVTNREGLPLPEGSAIAEAVLARADWIREHNGDGAVVMATATPVTNSPAEMWVLSRLVSPTTLENAGIKHFDAFAANFLASKESVEFTAGGQLKPITRLADYKNFPDLARLFRSIADVRKTEDLGFTLPDIVGGRAHVHAVKPSDDQLQVAAWTRERSEGKHLHPLPPDVRDPVVAILSTSRAAALHPATISQVTRSKWATTGFPHPYFDWDEPVPKLVAAADKIAEIHHRTANNIYGDSTIPGAAQALFCDYGVPDPQGGPSVYALVTGLLVERGVDRQQIAWVHDYPDPARRQPLWDQVRNGRVRVLIGSTMQMGIGVNIQTRLYAMHEVTAPYRPDWLVQGEGRGRRQGNLNPQIEIHRYVSERTADAPDWQRLHRKQHFITIAMSDPEQMTRDLRDESILTPAEEFATIAAIATGDNRHVELAAMTASIARLERAERAHHASSRNQQRSIHDAATTITTLTAQLATVQQLRPRLDTDTTGIGQQLIELPVGERVIQLDGITYHARRAFEGITLTIPDTSIRTFIDRNRLQPLDSGRGLGTSILNDHRDIPDKIEQLHDRIRRAGRQRDAELARPVPTAFQRADELATARIRHRELLAELQPKPAPTQPSTTPVAGSVAPVGKDAGSGGHPIFGNREPQPHERAAWVGAYRHYDQHEQPRWGNRARDTGTWAAAVNTFSTEPVNQHPFRRHDIGHFNGIAVTAQITASTMHLAPRVQTGAEHFPVYETVPGRLDPRAFEGWLRHQHTLAVAERNTVHRDINTNTMTQRQTPTQTFGR